MLMAGKQCKQRKGFTLAEVLITLSIIGVVAALTVPAVTKSYEKSTNIAGYKKIYSDLDQAVKLIAIDNGGSVSGLYSSHISWVNAIASKMKTSRICGDSAGRPNCWHAANTDLTLNGTVLWQPLGNNAFVTSTGMFVSAFFDNYSCPNKSPNGNLECALVTVDINGRKGPNRMGRDIHSFHVFADGVMPNSSCTSNCCKQGSSYQAGQEGNTCGLEIMQGNYDWEN